MVRTAKDRAASVLGAALRVLPAVVALAASPGFGLGREEPRGCEFTAEGCPGEEGAAPVKPNAPVSAGERVCQDVIECDVKNRPTADGEEYLVTCRFINTRCEPFRCT
jgi:hypothetical protein